MLRHSVRTLDARLVTMLSVLIVAATVMMVRAQCPCYPYNGDTNVIICDDTSLTLIPDCVPNNITLLAIRTPSIPLVPETIRRFTNMEILYIEHFDNPQLTKTFLDGQRNLSEFGVTNTSLDYVDNEWFLYAPTIKTLDLSHNKIASLSGDTFSFLLLLDTVYLGNNQLTTLPPITFQGTALKNLSLRENPWNCDCELANFIQWTKDNGVHVGDEAFCLHPIEFEGLDLRYLTPELACKKTKEIN